MPATRSAVKSTRHRLPAENVVAKFNSRHGIAVHPGCTMTLAVTNPGSVRPSPALQDAMKAALDKEGERALVERLGITRSAAARLAAGMPVRKGTLVMAALRLGLDADQEVAEK